MKPEQLQVVSGISSGQDVFAVLPAGFGKRVYFACVPVQIILCFDRISSLQARHGIAGLSFVDIAN